MVRREVKVGATLVDVLTPRDNPDVPLDSLPGSVPSAAVASPARPVPESELTPEQRQIRELQNQLAVERGSRDPVPALEAVPNPGADGNIIIHFVAEGFTALGAVWHRGQELEFVPGSESYARTCDRNGWSWLELRDNPAEQEARFREVKFRSGPWPGKSYEDIAEARFEPLKPLKAGDRLVPSVEELARAAKAEARRGRAAPLLPVS